MSARRALDAAYALFFDLLAGTTTALATARTLAEERARAVALAALDRAKTAFFSNISHAFRTPLTLVLGSLDDALADGAHPLPAPQQERLALVQRNTLRLQRLVNSLLDFARIGAGRLQADFAPLDLAAYTAELAGVFRTALEKTGLALEVDCPPLRAPVCVDAGMWEKIVFNLLSNALEFTFAGGVRVSLREEDGQAVLRVAGTGEGLAAAELPKLFTRFYRAEGTRSRSYEGSGTGLAFVQELVQLHGGAITAESRVGQGSTFAVRLPLGAAHLPAEQVRDARPAAPLPSPGAAFVAEAQQWPAGAPAEPAGPGAAPAEVAAGARPADEAAATILVVDDNADMRGYVQRILAREPQWTVRTAADGLQALEDVAQQLPDLVLSDVVMPRLDGFGLLQALKQNPDTARIPVVLLSARAGEEATVEGLDKGADDYLLVKPFAARELLARVRTQLATTRTRQDNTRLRFAEGELRASEQRYRTLIEESPVAMALYLGPEIRIQYANALMLGYWGKPAAVLGLSFRKALPELESQPFPALLEQVYATGQPYVGVRQAATLLVAGAS
ncbi:response regulator [Hymenobacter caeli]|uniref:histidine kinase n=1 Tax=Hymenobacter caeli TaxID=2735894 RepID=A0ABX2FTD3_9BACT|nr:response regulator [Hymenobacter caeli]NRT19734.1 CheY-like chemotaxis protein [Hymenobacter caeli]